MYIFAKQKRKYNFMEKLNKTITTVFAILCVLSGWAQSADIKTAEPYIKDYIELLNQEGFQIFSFDVSSLNEGNYVITPEVRSYPEGEKYDPFDMVIHYTNRDMTENGELVHALDRINLSFTPSKNDSIRVMQFHVGNVGNRPFIFILHPIKNEDTGEMEISYGFRQFKVDKINIGGFTPLLMYGSYWYDKDSHMLRQCGEMDLEPDLSSAILKQIPHYYVIGFNVEKR